MKEIVAVPSLLPHMPTDTLRPGSPNLTDLEKLIETNSREREDLLSRESTLRQELREIISQKTPSNLFEQARDRERQCRADLTRNLEQYDVLIEKWAEEGMKAFHR